MYLAYLLRHKWFVARAGRKLGLSWWACLAHDASKFLPSEWFPYAATFYAEDGSKQYSEAPGFNMAWLSHQHRNKHHWQYYLLRQDRPDNNKWLIQGSGDWEGDTRIHEVDTGIEARIPDSDRRAEKPRSDLMVRRLVRHANRSAAIIPLEMPERYAIEMVADWAGAGRAITGRWEVAEWYKREQGNIGLHERTRAYVEQLIETFENQPAG